MTTHPAHELITRYAAGATGVDDATVWAVEAHLESCAACRARLAGAVDPGTRDLLARVASGVAAGVDGGPGPVPRRRPRRTAGTARVLPWLAMAATLTLAAVVFEQTFARLPSLVLLVAPVVPLLPVAAVWSRRADPAWELTAATPRAGLWLLLRRSLAVLAAVVPVLAAAGWLTGHAPALWLLPCLALTAGSLALDGLVGVERAAIGLTVLWSVGVVAPSLSGRRLPALLDGGAWPAWAALTAVLTAVVLARAAARHRPRTFQ